MKKLIVLLVLLAQITCFSQNIVTELWVSTQTVKILNITYAHEHLYYGNSQGSWDAVITFTPINSTEVNYLLYYFKPGVTATIKMRLPTNVVSTTGTVDFIKQSGVKYSITIKGVQMINPYQL